MLNNQGQLSAVYAPCGSYAYNVAGGRAPVLGPSGLISPGLGFGVYSGQLSRQPVRESDVRAPADLYAFGDAPLSFGAWGNVAPPRLGGAADYNIFEFEDVSIKTVQHAVESSCGNRDKRSLTKMWCYAANKSMSSSTAFSALK